MICPRCNEDMIEDKSLRYNSSKFTCICGISRVNNGKLNEIYYKINLGKYKLHYENKMCYVYDLDIKYLCCGTLDIFPYTITEQKLNMILVFE